MLHIIAKKHMINLEFTPCSPSFASNVVLYGVIDAMKCSRR
ncbi:MAG: hypothetical protein ACNYWM_13155 [Methanosarcinales archaeon]